MLASAASGLSRLLDGFVLFCLYACQVSWDRPRRWTAIALGALTVGVPVALWGWTRAVESALAAL